MEPNLLWFIPASGRFCFSFIIPSASPKTFQYYSPYYPEITYSGSYSYIIFINTRSGGNVIKRSTNPYLGKLTLMSAHINWLHNTGQSFSTSDGKNVEIWELTHQPDEAILSSWATHFRNHYCPDCDLPNLVNGTGKTHREYLLDFKFPGEKKAPGPSIRSGDFAEILVTDFIEYIYKYWCPREFRYQEKWNRNESTKGCDVVGFKFVSENPAIYDVNDEIMVVEVKAALSPPPRNQLQVAIEHSAKDMIREAITLNGIKQRFLKRSENENANKVQRFQNETAHPFKRISGAVAVLDNHTFDTALLEQSDTSKHPNSGNLMLLVIKGDDLMVLVHHLYERAANEA